MGTWLFKGKILRNVKYFSLKNQFTKVLSFIIGKFLVHENTCKISSTIKTIFWWKRKHRKISLCQPWNFPIIPVYQQCVVNQKSKRDISKGYRGPMQGTRDTSKVPGKQARNKGYKQGTRHQTYCTVYTRHKQRIQGDQCKEHRIQARYRGRKQGTQDPTQASNRNTLDTNKVNRTQTRNTVQKQGTLDIRKDRRYRSKGYWT